MSIKNGFEDGEFFLFNLDILIALKKKFNWCEIIIRENSAQLELFELGECSKILYINDHRVEFKDVDFKDREEEKVWFDKLYLEREETQEWKAEDKETYMKETMEYLSSLIAHAEQIVQAMDCITTTNRYFDTETSKAANKNKFNVILNACKLPPHLIRLEFAARMKECFWWTKEDIIDFVYKWSRNYNGRYAHEDVLEVLRCYGVDSESLETALRFGGIIDDIADELE